MRKLLNAFKWFGITGGAIFAAVSLGAWIVDRTHADTLIIPNSFTVGQVADPTLVNANFDAIQTLINGKIDDDNWDDSGPGISTGHIATGAVTTASILDSTIVTGDIADHAVTVTPVTTLAAAADVNMTTSDQVLLTVNYTPIGTAASVLLVVNSQYYNNETVTQSAYGTLTLFIDGASAVLNRFGVENIGSAGDSIQAWHIVSFSWLVTGLSNASHTFELRHKKTDINGTGGTVTYKGTVSRASMTIQELKK